MAPAIEKPGQEAARIKAMFGAIAGRYDVLNRLLSGWTDVAWRNMVADEAMRGNERWILDLACGTGDLALTLRRRAPRGCRVVGADFSGPMLRLARNKMRPGPESGISWIEGDGLRLPFADQRFDLLTIAFGIRNMESLDGALREMHRVLRPGGRVAILEFSHPENAVVRALYMPYFLHVLPRIGALLSQRSAYLYLPHSVLHFPGRHELATRMRAAGFARVRHAALSMGIAALHIGERAR